jgi:hypothetical protein
MKLDNGFGPIVTGYCGLWVDKVSLYKRLMINQPFIFRGSSSHFFVTKKIIKIDIKMLISLFLQAE